MNNWKIVALSDIHIRTVNRHEEYKLIFEKTLQEIEKLQPDYIFNLGDTFHNKLQLSPESIILAKWFFEKLALIAPTYTLVGNHDMNVTNPNRPSSVNAVLNDIPNHFILDSSKFITLNKPSDERMGLCIGHYAFNQPKSEWPIKVDKKHRNDYINIALYHGAVDLYQTDAGWQDDSMIKYNECFLDYDMLLCGDIHSTQKLNKKAWMVGNLIQQNFGEDVNKGFLYLEIGNKEDNFVEKHSILNDYNYLNVFIPISKVENAKNVIVETLEDQHITNKSNIRIVVSTNNILDVSFKEDITSFVLNKYGINPIIEEAFRLNENQIETKEVRDNYTPINFSNVSYQNELIENYLKNNFTVPDGVELNDIFNINKEINNELGITKSDGSSRLWNILKLEFQNMFQYSHVEIDFQNDMSGLIGLFGDNASGKSNLFNALSFIIFGKTTTNVAFADVIRSGEDFAKGQVYLTNGDSVFRINRELITGTRAAKHIVKFEKLENGSWIPMNEETVPLTNKAIADIFGSFENFILTTLSVQNNYFSFVRSTNTQRKDVVMENLGIGIFNSLFDISKQKIKEVNAVIDVLGDTKPLLTNLQLHKDEINKIKEDNKSQKELLEKSTNILKSVDEKVSVFLSKIKPINCVIIDKDNIQNQIKEYESEIKKLELLRSKIEMEGVELKEKITKSKEDIKKLVNACRDQINNLNIQIGILKESIKKYNSIKEKYGEINCKESTCVLLMRYQEEAGNIDGIEDDLQLKLQNQQKYKKMLERFENEMDWHQQLERITNQSSEVESKIINLNLRIENKKQLIEEFDKSKHIIQENEKVQKSIDDLSFKRGKIVEILSMAKAKIEANKKLTIEHERQITTINLQIEQLFEMRRKANALIVYRDIMNQNSLPNTILNNYISILETEVNRILGTSLGLSVKILLDLKDGNKKSELNISFKNIKDEWYPIEASSGAEEMLLSLAIRVALINITSISRCNMLVIDEGFGNLHSTKIPELGLLFDKIKRMFKTIIIISHLESIHDFVEKAIVVSVEDKVSKLVV